MNIRVCTTHNFIHTRIYTISLQLNALTEVSKNHRFVSSTHSYTLSFPLSLPLSLSIPPKKNKRSFPRSAKYRFFYLATFRKIGRTKILPHVRVALHVPQRVCCSACCSVCFSVFCSAHTHVEGKTNECAHM